MSTTGPIYTDADTEQLDDVLAPIVDTDPFGTFLIGLFMGFVWAVLIFACIVRGGA